MIPPIVEEQTLRVDPFLGPVDTFLRQTRNPKILDVATGTGM